MEYLYKRMIKITFLPDKKNIEVNEGTILLDALDKAGINIDTPCGGMGICGDCKVLIKKGISVATLMEKNLLTEEEIKRGFRLACQTKLLQDTIIEIPSEIRLDFKRVFSAHSKGDIYHTKNNFSLESNLKKVFLDLEEPSLDDQRSDVQRIKGKLSLNGVENISNLKVSIQVLQKLPVLIRKAGYKVTVTMLNNEIIDLEKADTTGNSYGIAFDIGTTTVAGYLIDLKSGKELSVVAKTNPQIIHGDDVISRIGFAQQSKDNLEILQKEIVATLNEIIRETTQKMEIDKSNIYEIAIVGNTCMHHLFLGINPVNLGPSPYIPVVKESLNLKVKDIPGLALNQDANIHMLANISAFVGADISAGILFASMWRENKTILFVDLGTNGELVLGSKKELWSCSAAAGPAFEGFRISSGMRAAEGAIGKVQMDHNSIIYKVIADGKVRGICGSGLIDLIAELLKLGLIDKSGKLLNREECNPSLSEEIQRRMINGQKGNKFLLTESDETVAAKSIYLTQRDIREVQLAKAAVCAGIKILLKEANIIPGDIQKILLAGAFGNYIDKKSAVRIGLIPDLPLEKIESVGNAAGRGAEIALCSDKMREVGREISEKVKYIELSSRPDFQEEFIEAMFFNLKI
jgi:uncharacterized 2Fe-2S/4Fe-4S cluster protein (DUF4445 family)